MCKLLCLFLVLMILYLIQNKCEKEGFFSMMYKPKQCKDDPKWFVENNDGKHYCGHIGKSVSCYDRDAIGREGWETCLKSCGNCANTKVSKVPMGILAGFSGDPYEDFGVVLHKSEDRQWVGKTASEDDKDDIRGYVMGKEHGEAIDELDDKVSSMEDIFDMITGNIKGCGKEAGETCPRKGGNDGYKGCDNDACLSCEYKPSKNSYIRKMGDSITFPSYTINCENKNLSVEKQLDKIEGSAKQSQLNYDLDYVGCFEDTKKDDDRNMKGLKSSQCGNVSNCHTLTSKSVPGKKNECAKTCTDAGAQYMGIQYGNQCFCSKTKPNVEELGDIRHCGLGGSKCFIKNGGEVKGGPGVFCDKNAVFRINSKRKDDKKESLSDRCKNYFLFDKAVDKGDDDDDDKDDKNKRVTLHDMCPIQCEVKACKKKT
jgi:hypothetical protein